MSFELTLTFIPSPLGIDWSTPKTLAISAFKNRISLKSRYIGHVFVELKGNIGSTSHHYLTGMSSEEMDTVNQIMWKQKGFGVLFHNFPGKLEKKEDLEIELARYYKEGRVSFIRYLLHPENFKRLVTYLEEYKKRNGYKYYGGHNRPRHLEGSGCTAFGMSFLDVAGILTKEHFNQWAQVKRIPLKLSGHPLTKNKISFWSIIRNASGWAEPEAEHQPFYIWDPDLMHRWVLQKVKNFQTNLEYTLDQKEKCQGLVFDLQKLTPTNEPLFFEEQSEIFKRALQTES